MLRLLFSFKRLLGPTSRVGAAASSRDARALAAPLGREGYDAAGLVPSDQGHGLVDGEEPGVHRIVAGGRLARYPARRIVDQHRLATVMEMVDHVDQAEQFGADAGLFLKFAQRGLRHTLAHLHPPARQAPLA